MEKELLTKSLRKFADSIDSVSDERGSGDSDDSLFWVYLKDGLTTSSDPGNHTVNGYSLKEVRSYLEDVVPCDCQGCTGVAKEPVSGFWALAEKLQLH